MIYISAQPDDVYFLWQLELQLYNFHSVGIGNESIHILVGYKPEKGIHPLFKNFACNNKDVKIYFYPDNRKKKKYLSSIRPHLLAQHFRKNPKLEKEIIFYHDSDILFTGIPNWDSLCMDEVWYVSDTRSYLDSLYIKRFMDEVEFARMCSLLSVTPEDIIKQDANAGGAQYILKSCTAKFWDKVENDCELLFTYLYNEQKYGTRIHKELQIWCTDMWVIWWNAILQKRSFLIHPKLDFCWADSPSNELKNKKILHYTGSKKKDIHIFEKTLFQTHSPFYTDLSGIEQNTCSWFVVETIREYRKELDKKRSKQQDVRLLLIVPDTKNEYAKANVVKCYYERYWDMDVAICTSNQVDIELLQYQDRCNFLVPYNRIIPVAEMNILFRCIRMHKDTFFVFKMKVWQLDSLGSHIFIKIIENAYLEDNKGKTIGLCVEEELKVVYKIGERKEFVKEQRINVYGL